MGRLLEGRQRGLGRLSVLVLLLAAPSWGAEDASPALRDQWNALYLNGQKCGYERTVVRRIDEDGKVLYETKTHMEFAMGRGSLTLRFVSDKTIRESAEGRLVAFRFEDRQGPVFKLTEGTVEGEQMVLKTGTALSSSAPATYPAPKGLCPWALDRQRAQKGFKPGTRYTFPAFLPDFPNQAVQGTCVVAGAETVEAGGEKRMLHRLDYTFDLLPGVDSREWVDDDNTAWVTTVSMGPGLTLEARLVRREQALSRDDPADLLPAAFVPCDRPVVAPRTVEHLYLLMVPKEPGTAVAAPPSGPWQTVTEMQRGIHLAVRKASPSPEKSYPIPYDGEEYAELLAANRWLETKDPVVAEMARTAVGDASDALAAALRIEAYVHEAITSKDLSIGMATAAETARQKAGDCTEHAVLVAGLARAAGIPSRVVEGLVYVDATPAGGPGFGYHMWAEAYVGEWLPLDAVFHGHDATHVALGRSDLNSPDTLAGVTNIVASFGRFTIRVLGAGEGPGLQPAE